MFFVSKMRLIVFVCCGGSGFLNSRCNADDSLRFAVFFFFFVLFGILNSVDWFLFTRGFDVLSGEGRDFLCTR